ncbi:MAG TPA: DUF1566 domain-containing protein [Anaerolineae bacterium]|nr:DUF1566 domain-containing protein [Anaerolineae bacterium]
MRSRWMAILVMVVVLTVAGVSALSAAVNGPVDPPNPPGSTSSYTLEQIYQRLTTGNYFAQQSGFTEPASGPGTGTMHTLDEIMAQAQPRALAKRVAKTGQTQCWDTGGALIPCAGTGQDGQHQAGIEPAVAAIFGTAYNTPAWTGVRFTDNGDGTVTDNLTALIWLKNANCFGARNWANALSDANALASGSCGLSDGSIAGGWRLPNANELHSLIDLAQSDPALPAGHPFTGVQLNLYWTSTTVDYQPAGVVVVAMSNGAPIGAVKGGFLYVWPVRGGQ